MSYNIKELIENFLLGNEHDLKRFLYDKNFRCGDLDLQHNDLIEVFNNFSIPLNHRLNALTAASHKAMESMDSEKVKNVILLLVDNLNLVCELGSSKAIRDDQNHIYFSMKTVLLHCYVFTKNFIKAKEHSQEVCDKVIAILRSNEINEAFYQTCTNVSRCVTFLACEAFCRKDINEVKFYFKTLQYLMSEGLRVGDSHPTKFSEWFYSIETLNMLSKINSKFEEFSTGVVSLENIFEKYPIEKRIIRPHGSEKYAFLTSNLRSFFLGVS